KQNFNFRKEWEWILNDNNKINNYNCINNINGLFNLNYINQNNDINVHRSGWQFVYDNLKYYNNNEHNLLLDLYIDRTFHWDYEILKILNIIPYKKEWIGFIHHTFDLEFSNYNNYNLLFNED